MLPTFSLTGDLILAEKLSTRFEKMQQGDVVLVRSPENPRKIVVKRLMGMGGDTVKYAAGPGNNDKKDTIVVIIDQKPSFTTTFSFMPSFLGGF